MTPEFTASRLAAIKADAAYTQALASAYLDTPTWVSRYWTDHQNPARNAWEIVPV
jgi:hypothetical protein